MACSSRRRTTLCCLPASAPDSVGIARSRRRRERQPPRLATGLPFWRRPSCRGVGVVCARSDPRPMRCVRSCRGRTWRMGTRLQIRLCASVVWHSPRSILCTGRAATRQIAAYDDEGGDLNEIGRRVTELRAGQAPGEADAGEGQGVVQPPGPDASHRKRRAVSEARGPGQRVRNQRISRSRQGPNIPAAEPPGL
jgi:hypothetical protein